MGQALIFVGKNEEAEIYQLLMPDCRYLSSNYTTSQDRKLFLEETSESFVDRILEHGSPIEVGVYNGMIICPNTNRHEKVPQLDWLVIKELADKITLKLSERAITMRTKPDLSRN